MDNILEILVYYNVNLEVNFTIIVKFELELQLDTFL